MTTLGALSFLIRTRHEGGWTTDGIFAPLEAISAIEAFRADGGKLDDIRVFVFFPGKAAPVELTTVSAKRVSDGVWGHKWYAGTSNIFFTK